MLNDKINNKIIATTDPTKNTSLWCWNWWITQNKGYFLIKKNCQTVKMVEFLIKTKSQPWLILKNDHIIDSHYPQLLGKLIWDF